MNILIVDEVHPYLIERLREEGYTVDYHPDYTYIDTSAVIVRYHGVVVRSKFRIDRELMDKGTKLQFIARAGVGLDLFDTEYAEKKGIRLINAAGANADAVAEHMIGMMLSLLHHITKATFEVKAGEWQREANRGTELREKTVGLIGYGNVGEAVAEKLGGFGCRIIAYDKYRTGFDNDQVKEVGMEEILATADIISLHVPLTDETLYMCDEDFFARCNKPVYFLNTARGKIVELEALLNALTSGKVKGAGLDVLENEDLRMLTDQQKEIYEGLFALNNVVLSPHVAGWSVESFYHISAVLAKNILNVTNR